MPLPFGAQIVPALGGPGAPVYVVDCGLVDGRPVVISDGPDHLVRVWDLASHRQIGPPLEGESPISVWSLAFGTLDGRPVAVRGHGDLTIWELTGHGRTDRPAEPRYIRYNARGSIYAVACGVLDGRSIAVTGAYDKTVRVWDLADGTPVGTPMTGHESVVRAVAVDVLARRTIAVTAGEDNTVRVWDLSKGRQHGRPLTGHTEPVWAVAVGMLDGRPVAVSGGDDHTLRLWDLPDGRQIGPTMTGHTGRIRSVAFAAPDGVPIIISGSSDYSVRVWDARTGEQRGMPLTDGRTLGIESVAYSLLGGRPRVVAADGYGFARVWNLDAHRAMGAGSPTRFAAELPGTWTDPDSGDVYDLTGPLVDDEGSEWKYVDFDGFEPLVTDTDDPRLGLSVVFAHDEWGFSDIVTPGPPVPAFTRITAEECPSCGHAADPDDEVTIDTALIGFLNCLRHDPTMTDETYREMEGATKSLRNSAGWYLEDGTKSTVEKLPDHMGEFLGLWMPRSISLGSDDDEDRKMEAIGQMVVRLAGWLGERGHLSAAASTAMAAEGREAARDLPAGKSAGRALKRLIADSPYAFHNLEPAEIIDEWMGDMTITKIGRGSLRFTGYDDPPQDMTLPVPAELGDQIGSGWTVWVRLVRTESAGWQFNQIGTVFT
ncbi:WD40 repeat domain-containing protein [Actinomadura sp. KC216]|uniref:WD40 repeat domain-containing protein n=1 Tax=Actinomadura sp. KC216 TaxID=2530370 RepID=UPI0014042E55|nr:WD40 repeat domain-containing protein [Actinomadura sp. KC216]